MFVRQALSAVELLARVDREGVEPSNHRLNLPQLPLRRGCFAELSAIRPTDSGTRNRTSVSTFRAWRPARWTIPERWHPLPCARQSWNGAPLSRASPSTPEDGRRRSRRLPREVGHWVSVSPAEGQTMFSMPLANPSTLDRRAARCASSTRLPSYVEGLWSPSLDALAGKAQDKAERIVPAYFPARGREGLSLSGGASIRSRACSS